ncbi:MAG: hypothetical protein GX796_00680 [Clostridiaceae bacterium]|nr:hypothetical protein [Clostridiaceae bacterium]
MEIKIIENGIYLDIDITEDKDVRLLNLSRNKLKPRQNLERYKGYRLVELHESGMNQDAHHSSKHIGSCPGYLLKYHSHKAYRNEYGRKLEIVQEYEGLFVTSHIQFFNQISVIRSWTEINNKSAENHPLEYISSFALTGISDFAPGARDKDALMHIPHSTWYGEAQWKTYTLNELGYDVVNNFSVKRVSLSSTGTWPSSEYLPMGSYENISTNSTISWQI